MAALALSTGRDVQYRAALALALAGDVARAQGMPEDLSKHFSDDTIVHFQLPADQVAYNRIRGRPI